MSSPRQPADSPKAFIVLGTCNGARYLSELVDSVRRQSYRDWTMLVRDDQSDDGTAALLEQLAAEDPRLVILPGDSRREGPIGNFARLLESARDRGADYVLPADQDDVWLPEKISRQMELMRRTEVEAGAGEPVLVYSDLSVVDAGLRTVHPSFFRHGRFRRNPPDPLRTLLAHNFIPACAMLLNRPLLELVLPVPPCVPMHDWWIALCAAAAGRLACVSQAMLLYRQHGHNTVGARGGWASVNPLAKGFRTRWRQSRIHFARHVEQARALRDRLRQRAARCSHQTLELLEGYCRSLETRTGTLHRIHGIHRLGIPQTVDLSKRLSFYARLLAQRPGARQRGEPRRE
ncbi:MAG: glycosyltransferase family 2 protein [Pirellulales bacterium]|nr:glycosyltransferase family 2 protein [Pirellulales bacterium]